MENNNFEILNTINDYKDFKNLDVNKLAKLADEIRQFIINLSNKKNIHLSSNLGIIETSIALSYSFNLDKDILFYDIGHQSYTHKIITGRKNLMQTIRDVGGLCGFQNFDESKYDYYSGGHAGNSLSIAAGYLEMINTEQEQLKLKFKKIINLKLRQELNNKNIKKIQKINKQYSFKNRYVVPIIGDGALCNGLALEALNNISFRNIKPIIVLNDNGMSISQSIGSIPYALSRIKINYFKKEFNKKIRNFICKTKLGTKIYKKMYYYIINKVNKKNNPFEFLGYKYIGPIDGHNINKIIKACEEAKWYQQFQPIILHIKTIKGKGLLKAQKDKIGNYHIALSDNKKNIKLTGDYLSEHLMPYIIQNPKIRVINPGMTYNSGFLKFAQQNPSNYIDVGIAEQHALSIASGIVIRGGKAIIVIYSTFLQRAYDQLIHDFSRLNLPLTLLIDRCEISINDGKTHHGIFDVNFLKSFPNVIISTPANIIEAKMLLDLSLKIENKIFAIRYPKILDNFEIDDLEQNVIKNTIDTFNWRLYSDNKKNKKVIVTYGKWVNIFLKIIKKNNLPIDVVNAIFITNYEHSWIDKICSNYKDICVFEEIYGNLGLANDFKISKYAHKVNFLFKNFKTFPINESIEDIYTQNNMNSEITIKELMSL